MESTLAASVGGAHDSLKCKVYVGCRGRKPRDDESSALFHFLGTSTENDFLKGFANRGMASASDYILVHVLPEVQKRFSLLLLGKCDINTEQSMLVRYIRQILYKLLLQQSKKEDRATRPHQPNMIPAPAGYVLIPGAVIISVTDFPPENRDHFFGGSFQESFKSHLFPHMSRSIKALKTKRKGKKISQSNPSLIYHGYDRNTSSDLGTKSQSAIFDGNMQLKSMLDGELLRMIRGRGYSTERFVVPSALWNIREKSNSTKMPSGLQRPHIDWDISQSSCYKPSKQSRRPLACLFPIDAPMFLQIWPTGPGNSTIICIRPGEVFFFEPTLVHGGGVGSIRVHCYIAENITETVGFTSYSINGTPYDLMYNFSMIGTF